MKLNFSPTCEHADAKCHHLVAALLCFEDPLGEALPLSPCQGVSQLWGGSPGPRGVFGDTWHGSHGARLQRCPMSVAAPGCHKQHPNVPSTHGNAALLLSGCSLCPHTSGTPTWSLWLKNNWPGVKFCSWNARPRELRCLRGEAEQPPKGVITSGCKALTSQNLLPPPIRCFLHTHRPFFGRERGCGG